MAAQGSGFLCGERPFVPIRAFMASSLADDQKGASDATGWTFAPRLLSIAASGGGADQAIPGIPGQAMQCSRSLRGGWRSVG